MDWGGRISSVWNWTIKFELPLGHLNREGLYAVGNMALTDLFVIKIMDQRLTDNRLCAYISRLLLNSGDLSAFAILAQETISNKLICFMLHERFKLLPMQY